MAFLDKLKFWKKGDDAFADLDKQLGTMPQTPGTPESQGYGPLSHEQGFTPSSDDDLLRSSETGLDFGKQGHSAEGFSGFGMEHPGDKQMPSYEQPRQVYEVAPQAAAPAQNVSQQLELVAAKLDTIRVSLESINHRLVAVERALHVQDEEVVAPRRRRGVW